MLIINVCFGTTQKVSYVPVDGGGGGGECVLQYSILRNGRIHFCLFYLKQKQLFLNIKYQPSVSSSVVES